RRVKRRLVLPLGRIAQSYSRCQLPYVPLGVIRSYATHVIIEPFTARIFTLGIVDQRCHSNVDLGCGVWLHQQLTKVYRAEEQKVDTTQQGREFLDQITRDIHQAGYPGQKMYDSAILAVPPANDSRVAVGLVRVSASELWFEGDMDGDGAVESVRYTLFDNNGNAIGGASNCPCSLQRSVVL